MNNMWPAWKVSLFAFLFSFVGVLAAAGLSGVSAHDPRSAGERAGEQFGWIILLAPLLGYVLQKWRLDRAKEAEERERVPMARATERRGAGPGEEQK